MAPSSFFVLLTIIGTLSPCIGRADPQYNGVFVARIDGAAIDTPLERTEVHTIVKVGLMGFNGVSSTVQVLGDRSPVRFSSGVSISLIVKTAETSEDPHGLFKIVNMNITKGTRHLRRNYTGWGQRQRDATDVMFDAQPYKSGMFKLSLPTKIAPGEYCAMGQPHQTAMEAAMIGDHDLMPAFCFGID